MTYVLYISFLVRMGTPFFPRMGFLSMPKIWLAFLTRASTACLSSRLSWITAPRYTTSFTTGMLLPSSSSMSVVSTWLDACRARHVHVPSVGHH